MLSERGIGEEWVKLAVSHPAGTEHRDDGTIHCLSPIPEQGGRVLRVVVRSEGDSLRVITAFFDRRAKGE